MSELRKSEAKRMFRRDIVKHGLSRAGELRKVFPAYLDYSVPEEELEAWLTGMSKGIDFTQAPATPRLVNRFALGADPEFVFVARGIGGAPREIPGGARAGRMEADGDGNPRFVEEEPAVGKDRRVDASILGLKTGLAFGADQNGRLAELRVYPSRSALEVVASTLDTLRWMAALTPKAHAFDWVAGAWQFNDGLGGHVHFGRKRPTTPTEARALDTVCEHLLDTQVFPSAENLRRRQGDAHGQRYGQLFASIPDIDGRDAAVRRQQHGYEYRAYPSWLDSPEQCYLTLVLSKLVVLDPDVVPEYAKRGKQDTCMIRIRNILRYFQGQDDDARIALMMIDRAWPVHVGGDFRKRWGLADPKEGLAKVLVKVVPTAIEADRRTVEELFYKLVLGTQLSMRIPVPTWSPTTLPAGCTWMMDYTNPMRQHGIGELAAGMACNAKTPVLLGPDESGGNFLTVSPQLAELLPKDWQARVLKLIPQNLRDADTYYQQQGRMQKGWLPLRMSVSANKLGGFSMTIGREWRENKSIGLVKDILLSGIFPIWGVDEIRTDSFANWQAEQKQLPVGGPVKGKLIVDRSIS